MDFTLKKLNDDFYLYIGKARYGISILWTQIYSFYVADPDTVQFLFSTGKMCKFSRTLYYRQLIQFSRIPVEFVVRFIRYQNHLKVISFYIAAQYLLLIYTTKQDFPAIIFLLFNTRTCILTRKSRGKLHHCQRLKT